MTRFFSHSLLGLTAVALVSAAPASAQFGGLFKPPSSSASKSSDNGGCPKGKRGSGIGRSILGNVIGDVTGRAASGAGPVGSYLPSAEVASTLTDAIACRLDPKEQLQAAEATTVATRGEAVGSTASWTSDTRENVSGTSTVTGKTKVAGGTSCMNVTDVVIVEGQETTATKKMCKAPGTSRYVLTA